MCLKHYHFNMREEWKLLLGCFIFYLLLSSRAYLCKAHLHLTSRSMLTSQLFLAWHIRHGLRQLPLDSLGCACFESKGYI